MLRIKNQFWIPKVKRLRKQSIGFVGFTEVAEIRVGKYFEMHVQQTEAIEEKIEQICDQLLANVNMESYRFEILSLEEI